MDRFARTIDLPAAVVGLAVDYDGGADETRLRAVLVLPGGARAEASWAFAGEGQFADASRALEAFDAARAGALLAALAGAVAP